MSNSLCFDSFGGHASRRTPITLEEAQQVAKRLLTLPGVVAVELYGSIARDSRGNDLDLLLIVESEKLYQQFVGGVLASITLFSGVDRGAWHRLNAVEAVVGDDAYWEVFDKIRGDCSRANLTDRLDLFIMPENWKERIEEIQGNLPHNDKHFVRKIAQDARVIANQQ